jgi:hypothetical protein
MNIRLAQFIPFGSKRQHWYERYFNGSDVNWMLPVLGGIGLGAGLMYIFDPDGGRSRRAVARDRVTSAANRTGKAIGSKSRDLKNRARGIIAETGSMFRSDEAAEGSGLRQ